MFVEFEIMCEFAILPTCYSFCSADPKSSIATGDQSADIIARKVFALRRLPRHCANAIEAKQAGFCRKPEVAVGCLSNLVDGACGKTLADFPRGMRILADVEGGL